MSSPTYLGKSLPSQAVRNMIARVADSPATVLITGESGTGKELVARALHEQSGRRGCNFQKIRQANSRYRKRRRKRRRKHRRRQRRTDRGDQQGSSAL